MKLYMRILSGDETLAAEIYRSPAGTRFLVRMIDEETRRDAGIDALVGTKLVDDVDTAIRHANAWVTQTPVGAA